MTEVTPANYRYDNDALRGIGSFEDAFALVESTYGPVMTADSELGDGFELLKEKERLVGVPCLFISWSFSPGDYAEEMAAVRLVTKDGGKYVITDGSVGIRQQLREFTDSHDGRMGGLLARRGLRVSDYDMCDGKGCTHSEPRPVKRNENHAGKITKGGTFYVDTGA